MKNMFESLSVKDISKKDLLNIRDLELDMWSRELGAGEYIICNDCGKTSSKEDIHGSLPLSLKMQITSKIEQILKDENKEIKCTCGSSNIEHFHDKESYLEKIKDRHNDSKGNHLTVLRNTDGTIGGFMDWYIHDFKGIYKKDFEYFYKEIGEGKIKEIIESSMGGQLPKEIMFCSALGLEESKLSFYNVYEILKYHTNEVVKSGNGDIFGLYEVVLNTPVYGLYKILGGENIGFLDNDNIYNKSKNIVEGYERDIFFHKEMGSNCVKYTQLEFRKFLIKNKATINSLINR